MRLLPVVAVIANHTMTRSAPRSSPQERSFCAAARPGIRPDRPDYLAGDLRSSSPRGRHLPIRAGSRYITPRAVRTTFWLRTDSRAFIWTNWLPFAQ